MPEFIMVHDIVEYNGKTIKENNTAKKHIFEIGQLVELKNGCRLFVARYTRDCDGTPLYSLTPSDEQKFINSELEEMKWIHGYCDDSLKSVITPKINGTASSCPI